MTRWLPVMLPNQELFQWNLTQNWLDAKLQISEGWGRVIDGQKVRFWDRIDEPMTNKACHWRGSECLSCKFVIQANQNSEMNFSMSV